MSAPNKKPTNAQLFSDNYQLMADHPEEYPISAQDSYCLSTIAFCMAQIADDIHEINRKLKCQKKEDKSMGTKRGSYRSYNQDRREGQSPVSDKGSLYESKVKTGVDMSSRVAAEPLKHYIGEKRTINRFIESNEKESTVFCVGVMTIAFMIFIIFVVLLTGIVTTGEFDDPDVIILSLFIFISFAIIVGSIIFTKFMYEPEQFGYTKINYEHMEEIMDESN